MKFSPIPEEVAHAGLRAMKSVCSVGDGLTRLERDFLDGLQRHLLHSSFDLDALEPITGAELEARIPPGEFRERLIGGLVIAATIDGDVSKGELELIEGYAKALSVSPVVLRTGQRLAHHQFTLAKIDIARRALPGFKVKEVVREEGLPAMLKQLLPLLGVEDRETASRYRALEHSGAGTLGRAYYDFVLGNGFSFPGEKHSGPEIIVLHDLLHVLGDYGTTPDEEVLVAAFQAGTHRGEPFHQLLFALAQFHLGLFVAPVSSPETLRAEPAKMLEALVRGARVPRDTWADFKPWDHFSRSLDELRAELGIERR